MPTTEELLSDPSLGLIKAPRPTQLTMAKNIVSVLQDGGVYMVEAGTGIGKSFAYLVSSVLNGSGRTIITTANKALQDQLTNKDLPHLERTLGEPFITELLAPKKLTRLFTLLKGRGNYACRLLAEKQNPDSNYINFISRSPYGDKADLTGPVPHWWEDANAEDCVGQKCELADSCGYIRLRKDVARSSVIVGNHHLIGMDMQYGTGEHKLLGGGFSALVVDEAHNLESSIRSIFTVELKELALKRMQASILKTEIPFKEVWKASVPWAQLFYGLGRKELFVPVFDNTAAAEALAALKSTETEFADHMIQRGVTEPISSAKIMDQIVEVEPDPEGRQDLLRILRQRGRLEALITGLNRVQGWNVPPGATEEQRAHILNEFALSSDVGKKDEKLVKCEPVNVAYYISNYVKDVKSTVFTSATLAVDNKFNMLFHATGVKPTRMDILPTTFQLQSHGFVYIPKDLGVITNPKAVGWRESVDKRVERAVWLATQSNGGAFVLATSNEELRIFYSALKEKFPGRTFAQGEELDGPPKTVLEKFKNTPNAILVGVDSFWEGVDIQGNALRLVIIARLPFPFQDAMLKAKIRQAGDFDRGFEIQIRMMLIRLRQGVGRLIRSTTDHGVVAILDSRIWNKPYGKRVLSALQPFGYVDNTADCLKFGAVIYERSAQNG